MVCTPHSATFFPCVSTPCKVACRNVSLPLRSSEVSPLHSVAFFPCPDRSVLLRTPSHQCPSVTFFLTQRALGRHLAAVRRPHARPCHAVPFCTCPPCSAIRPGPQRLGCCNSGFISTASRSDAGSALGHGKCSACDWQRSPSSVHVNAPEVRLPSHPCRHSQPCEQA